MPYIVFPKLRDALILALPFTVVLLAYSLWRSDVHCFPCSCRYPDGRDQPEIVLAVGQNILWEDIRILTRTVGSVLGGLAVLGGSGVIAIVTAAVIAVKRRQSKRAAVGV